MWNEAIYRSIVDNSPDVIVVVDHEFRLQFINRVPQGRHLEDIIGMHFFEYITPQYREYAQPAFERAASTGQVVTFETKGLRPDGKMGYWSGRVIPVLDIDGRLVHLTQISTDITDIREAEIEHNRIQEEIIRAQNSALQELSTPIIPVFDGIIVMPLIGSINRARARDVMRVLLSGISQYRAKIVILDITGVPLVDTGVADYLHRAIQAARLKGAGAIVTGISDSVAETIVDLGIDWSGIETLRDLQTGLMFALERLQYRLVSVND